MNRIICFTTLILFFVLPQAKTSLASDSTAPVLEVTSTSTTVTGPSGQSTSAVVPAVELVVRNISTKCVRGFVLEIDFKNAQGKLIMRHARMLLRKTSDGHLGCLNPGQSFRFAKPVPMPTESSGESVTYATAVDLVVFDDGSTWGPAKLPEANQLLGMINEETIKDANKL